VVGTTGIEPVTPTMSTHCVDGNCSEIPGNRAPNVQTCSRLGPANDGHFLGPARDVSARSSLQGSPSSAAKGSSNSQTSQGRLAALAASKSEETDDYHAIVAHLNERWRVIVCAAHIQWILQRRTGERHGRARWEGRSYCRTSEALNRLSRRHAGAIDATAAAVLASLPEWIENVHRKPRL
jgi:hypothetical protein